MITILIIIDVVLVLFLFVQIYNIGFINGELKEMERSKRLFDSLIERIKRSIDER